MRATWTWRMASAAALVAGAALLVGGCGDDGGGADADALDDTAADTADDAGGDTADDTAGEDTAEDAAPDTADDVEADTGPAGSLALLRAFSDDGTLVRATFSAALDEASVTPSAFGVEAAGGAPGPAVAAAVIDGAEVRLTLAEPLDGEGPVELVAFGLTDTAGDALDPARARATIAGTLHLALIWHQHQPVYIDPEGDYLRGPWVRKHAVKDYYDMAAQLADHPTVHVSVNLTPVLLMQLEDYYLARLGPFVDVEAGTVDAEGYLAWRPEGDDRPVTDPWVDLLLRPTPAPEELTEEEKGWFWADTWSAFSISEVMIARFPAYQALLDKRDEPETFTQDDLLQLKGWFELAWFDPRFLRGPVTLPDGAVVDLSDLVTEGEDGRFTLNAPFTEETCQRLVVEDYKVMANVVGIHAALAYDADAKTGQIEVMTTPYYHPILPLLVDTELAASALPEAPLPPRFAYPQDAAYHVAKAVQSHEARFGRAVTGMWPAEGSVAEEVLGIFASQGVKWIATDRGVLQRSTPPDQEPYSPFRVDADDVVGDGGDASDALAIVFRDTELSDRFGFAYQGGTPANNVKDFEQSIRKHAPPYGEARLLTVILDGENAWEWYRFDNDAIATLDATYVRLAAWQETGEVRTVTPSEYLSGNAARKIPAHPLSELPELEPLWPGSWISGSFSTWIGEDEENLAWSYLVATRADLEAFAGEGLAPHAAGDPVPEEGTPAWHAWQAWETMYAAEGSDWFWWYGSDQTAVGGDEPFDRIFRQLLQEVYRQAQLAGIETEIPDFPPVLRVCNAPDVALKAPPVIDGAFDPDDGGDANVPNEWTVRGAGVCMDPDSGATVDPADDLAIYYHGATADTLYVALRMYEDVSAKLGTDYQIRLYFSHKHITSVADKTFEQDPFLAASRTGDPLAFDAGGAAREVTLDFSGAEVAALLAVPDGASWGAPAAAETVVQAVAGDVVEMALPFAALGYEAGDPLEMAIVVVEGGAELDRVPELGGIRVFPDVTQLVEVTLILDATGSKLALDAIKPIDDPPPPAGTGAAFIVGNLPELGNWTPNSVAMADDGETHGDLIAGDNFWTFRLVVPPLTDLQYKYTIGAQGEGWGPTEEYPLTNRGLLVTDADEDGKMVIEDVFADRPSPSGSKAKLSVLKNP